MKKTRMQKSWGDRSGTPKTAGSADKASAETLSRADQIYWTVRNRICTNRFMPGEIIREEELANEFEVSRSPIRRVLAKLEHEGLVEVRHGVGTRVTELDREALTSIYNIRMMLWAQTGPYFANPLPQELGDQLQGHLEAFRSLPPLDLHGFADVNIAYYLDLTATVENACMREMHRNLFFSTSRMWLIKLPLLDWNVTIGSISAEIEDKILAVRNNDPTGLGYVARNAIANNLVPLARGDGEDG